MRGAYAASEATLVDEDGLGLGEDPTAGEVERAAAAASGSRPPVCLDSQWLAERLESELQRHGALPPDPGEGARGGCPPTMVAPAVGPFGE